MILDTFRNQKCLETVKQQNPLNNEFSRDLVIEMLEGWKMRRLEIWNIQKFRGLCHFP